MTAAERNKHYFEVVHPQLQELAAQICNATLADDDVLKLVAYNKLAELHHVQDLEGWWHPHLTESLADFTDDESSSVALYNRALSEADTIDGEKRSILISLSRSLISLGKFEQAEANLSDARAEARKAGDTESISEIEELFEELQRNNWKP